ncbi:MAG: hypothetical protein P1V18_00215 [Candidatus Gracilibacteria bacterium]|nr:hypothetical protein [Candidatus Gracilibacteria bacterium]
MNKNIQTEACPAALSEIFVENWQEKLPDFPNKEKGINDFEKFWMRFAPHKNHLPTPMTKADFLFFAQFAKYFFDDEKCLKEPIAWEMDGSASSLQYASDTFLVLRKHINKIIKK